MTRPEPPQIVAGSLKASAPWVRLARILYRMATRTLVTVLSDLSGDGDASTVRFAIQDNSYEIDLTKDEAAELFRALDPYVKKSRKVSGGSRRSSSVAAARSTKVAGLFGRIKAWGRSNGFTVNDRGRPSRELVQAYEKATGESTGI